MTHINKVYGYLTDGDNTARKTTTSRSDVDPEARAILSILLPEQLGKSTVRGLAELYIRLCYTDKNMATTLLEIDPVNSYRLHSFCPPLSSELDIQTIVNNIKKSSIPDLENSSLPMDYIMTALKYLLKILVDGGKTNN